MRVGSTVCNEILAIPIDGLSAKANINLIYLPQKKSRIPKRFSAALGDVTVNITPTNMVGSDYLCARMEFTSPHAISREDIIQSWDAVKGRLSASELSPLSPIFPGYFARKHSLFGKDIDFEIWCPNPKCELNIALSEDKEVTLYSNSEVISWSEAIPTKLGLIQKEVIKCFRYKDANHARAIPIPGYTVDDQLYHSCPSMVIATVDKFARMAFEPKTASFFGNIEFYENEFGFYRTGKGNEPSTGAMKLTNPANVEKPMPPDLIIQDELHLIEGPLGSIVGLYEGAIDILCQGSDSGVIYSAKYVASTATIREARSQVMAVYGRKTIQQFPPHGLLSSDNFFSTSPEMHPRNDKSPGRLYMGICAPGTSAQTALKMIWSAALQVTNDIANVFPEEALERFRTVIGYFNAIRELSIGVGLYRHDIPEWMDTHHIGPKRDLGFHEELSSRLDSRKLPSVLDALEVTGKSAIPSVFATSLFGTGVDINRLGMMIVHGQPKTTAHYIQSTGRIGRTAGGLVLTFFRAARPRDLDHYEFFTRYHRAIQRYVEPISVCPFSKRAMERALGPISVTLLRNASILNGMPVNRRWSEESKVGKHSTKKKVVSGCILMQDRRSFREVDEIVTYFEKRAQQQPSGRRPSDGDCRKLFNSEIDRWKDLARLYPDRLLYWESPYLFDPTHPVVLGDAQHVKREYDVAFENAPTSMRNVENTARFRG